MDFHRLCIFSEDLYWFGLSQQNSSQVLIPTNFAHALVRNQFALLKD